MNIEYNFLKGWSLLKDSYRFNDIVNKLILTELKKKQYIFRDLKWTNMHSVINNFFIPKRGMYTDNLGFFVRQTSVQIYYEARCKENGKWEGGGEGVRGGWSARIIIEMMWYFFIPLS